ncbi:MFS transporter [uncultured Chryseobacterium sp.]|uniref:MFS transporter n=1 Tax=uncultured Chryseobacterium sp. TaxID=259322 RepID=UPI00374A5597
MKNTKSFTPDHRDITKQRTTVQVLVPIVLSVFAMYLTMGIALGSLPGFIKNDLKSGNFIIGTVIGLQSLSTLLTRAYAGKITDTSGANTSNRYGVFIVLAAGMMYILAVSAAKITFLALGLPLIARIIHGIAESMLVTGSLTWGISLLGFQHSGKVMTWNGIAMYAGIALGAPLSLWMNAQAGIMVSFSVIIFLAGVSWISTVTLPAVPVDPSFVRVPFYKITGKVSDQGLALAFSSMGFACIASFIALLFEEKSWNHSSLGFFCFGGFYILTRLLFSSYPDKFGGYKVALVSFIIEIVGQLCIGFSVSGWMAIVGCALTGIGFSLVFPALGVLAIRKIAPQMRGTALGAYSAFFDLSLGLAGPVAGLIAGWLSYQSVYIFGAFSCSSAILILIKTKSRNP